jgi:glycosyltransferase involved in cell wall biosynthesis
MKIGVDGIPLGGIKTGVGHYTFELAQQLARAEPDDELQVVSHIPFHPPAIENVSAQLRNLKFISEPVNVLTKHWWTIGLPLYLRRNSLDLFHGTNYDVPVWGGIPTVLTIHDLSLFLYPETHEQRRVRRARRRLPLMARLATAIIVPTRSVKNETCEHLSVSPEKVFVVHEAPRRCFRPMDPQQARETRTRLGVEDIFILYVGTIEPRKNLPTLVRAFEEIYVNTELRPQLVIAGNKGWLTEELFAHLAQSNVRDRILMTGYLGDDDLRALYSTCAVMNYPALYEGAGLPPLEAMACGAAVITTSAAAIAEMVGDGARLVAPKDHRALAKNIVELLTDPSARQSLSALGQKRAAEFTWERTALATHDIYLDAITRHGKKT